jgi:hypothetical protein
MRAYRANTEKVVWRIADGEAVLVHADTSAYYGLNAAATCIWEALVAAPMTRDDLGRFLGGRYGGDGDAFVADVDAFLASIAKESLVVEASTPTGPLAGEPGAKGVDRPDRRYEAPSLTRFGELEKLVLSGE